MGINPNPLPGHVEETVQAIGKLHADHHESATGPQRAVNYLIDFLGRPLAVAGLILVIATWVGLNAAAIIAGRQPLDPPPFAWLGDFVGVGGLLIAVLILAAQRHASQLAARRDQLTLQLALVSEQKSAKIIQLLEEMRRDNPQIANRVDEVAAAMSKSSDPGVILDAIQEAGGESGDRRS